MVIQELTHGFVKHTAQEKNIKLQTGDKKKMGINKLALKLLMHEFYYDKLKKYDSELNLLYMETDSYFTETKKTCLQNN